MTERSRGHARRGFTLMEVLVSSGLLVLVMTITVAVLALSGQMQQQVMLQNDADQGSVRVMNRLSVDVREASNVQLLSDSRVRIYHPIVIEQGYYDRFSTDYSEWVEYARTTENGTPSSTGTCIWRSTDSEAGRAMARDVTLFAVERQGQRGLKVRIQLRKRSGNRSGITTFDNRLLYMRNY